MSKQCLDISQMQHLKELGVDDSKANFYWHRTKSLNYYNDWDEWKLHYGILKLARGFTAINCEYVRTFTLQDILDLLPRVIIKDGHYHYFEMYRTEELYYVGYYWLDNPLVECKSAEFIDAAYEMLCWVIENGYLEV